MRFEALEFDDETIEHIARHGVMAEEVWQAMRSLDMRLFRSHRAEPSPRTRRYEAYGQTGAGRYLMVVLERVGHGVWRPVTARSMTDAERARYREVLGR